MPTFLILVTIILGGPRTVINCNNIRAAYNSFEYFTTALIHLQQFPEMGIMIGNIFQFCCSYDKNYETGQYCFFHPIHFAKHLLSFHRDLHKYKKNPLMN